VPFHRQPGDAGLPGPRRHVADDRLLPRLAGRARQGHGALHRRGEVQGHGHAFGQEGGIRRRLQARHARPAGARHRRRLAEGRRRTDLHRDRPQGRAGKTGRLSAPAFRKELIMRRVVVTGLGIVSSIGNDAAEVTASLRDAKSGISFSPDFAEHGFKCQVWGKPDIDPTDLVDRRAMRFLSQGGAWNHVAMKQAIADSGLEEKDYSENERTGIIMGSGGPSTRTLIEAADITIKNNSPKRIGPFAVPKAMSSTASATLATWFKIHGVNYSISSACSTSTHCIGNAAEMIQWGKQDVMFAGGHEDLDWTMSNLFDAMGAMSS